MNPFLCISLAILLASICALVVQYLNYLAARDARNEALAINYLAMRDQMTIAAASLKFDTMHWIDRRRVMKLAESMFLRKD